MADIEVRSAKGALLILGAGVLAGVVITFVETYAIPWVRRTFMRVAA